MSEELENSVREMLKEETWTRAGISNFTKNNLVELAGILERTRAENCENTIKEICDEQLSHTKDSIVALYLSGMISLLQGSLDNSNLVSIVDIFEKNHKEILIEYLCNSILEEDPQNRFALRKLAAYYKSTNNDKVWELYEKIVKIDFEEADIAKILAERYESQGNKETAVSYYKKALLRYVAEKNSNSTKEVWSKLFSLIPEEIDFFLLVQRKIAKSISEDRSATLMQEVYQYYKDTAKWDTAISILKLILSIDKKDSWARKEITDCFRGKYSDNNHLEDYIRLSGLSQSFRDVFEAISDFEKHIAFDARNYVFHRSWGVGIIRKVEGDMLSINFGKKNGVHQMSLKMAVSALMPLSKDHIWVQKATTKKEDLAKKVKSDVTWTLKTIIQSFDNSCDDKRIKAELVPAVLTTGEWTSWHAKAQQVFATDSTFSVDPTDNSKHTVRDHEISMEERLNNEFKAEKDFFARIDILMRFIADDETDKSDELLADMFDYFASFIKTASTADVQTIAAYLTVQNVCKQLPSFTNPASFTFAQLYSDIDNPKDLYNELKDYKNTSLKEDFIANVRQLPDWDDQYVKLFPTVLSKSLIAALLAAGKTEKVQKLMQDSFNDYRNYRNSAIYFFKEYRDEEWYKNSGISYEKQLVTLVNIISYCYREINSHVNTTDNKKTINNAVSLLFAEKMEGGVRNNMLAYMLSKDTDVITRMFTMVNDVKDLESKYKTMLRKGILDQYPDYKFPVAEIKQEAPKGLLATAKMIEAKKKEAEEIENVILPKIAKEIADAKEKGDLKENAEYISAKEARDRYNSNLKKLREQLARAETFDQTTVTSAMVSFGTKVTFVNNATGTEETFTILGPFESDVEHGIISYLSPVGAKLLDLKVNESKKFDANGKKYDITIKSIEIAKIN